MASAGRQSRQAGRLCSPILCAAALIILAVAGGAWAQEDAPPMLGILMKQVAKTEDAGTQLNLLRGINAAMKGRRDVTPPPEWEALSQKLAKSDSAEIREMVQSLSAVFGSASAFAEMRKTLTDEKADLDARKQALISLLAGRDAETLPVLLAMVKSAGPLRAAAIRGLATFDDPRTPEVLLGIYDQLGADEKRDALSVLLARPSSAAALVGGIGQKRVPAADIGAAQLRQLEGFDDPAIKDWLKTHAQMVPSSPDKQAEIARFKTLVTPETVKAGDAHRGRALFAQTCAICHKLFDAGAALGPELTGANRGDIDYLLQNIVDPNALIGEDYQMVTAELKDGRIVVGMVRGEDANTVTFKTLAEEVTVPRGDIAKREVSKVSMMPEGMLAALSTEQIADLFAYLGSPQQVPPVATPANAMEFFNGADLSGWVQSGDAWTLEDGQLIGRGRADKTVRLTSAMVAGDYKLTGQVRLNGKSPAAEIALRGMRGEGGFTGVSLSFGGAGAVNLWKYSGAGKPERVAGQAALPGDEWVPFEVEVNGDRVTVSSDGNEVVKATAPGGTSKLSQFALHLRGAGAELRVKDLKIEPAAP